MAGLTIRPLAALAQGLTALFQAPPDKIRGVDTSDWFGPLQPFKPIAPDGTEPRRYQYYSGQNLIVTPRSDLVYSSADLRAAATYPLARVLIENVKDSVSRLPLNVRLRRKPGESGKEYAKRKPDLKIVQDIGDILEQPNPEQNRQEFVRGLIEDMLVIDAPCILFRTTKKRQLVELRQVDGASITRYIDENGYTPLPPSPAYAQLWYGIPMVDLSTDQLLYAARNILPFRLYGFSPTEQAMLWIEIGSNRLQFKKSAYTEGNIPDAMQVVPMGVNEDKIIEAQNWMVSDLAGALGKRRQLRYVQGFTEKGDDKIYFPKEALLADSYDELEINCFCFAFGVSKQRLAKMMNRASAQADQDAADKEGLEPWLDWAANSVWNKIIQRYLGFADYEAVYDDDSDVDPLKDAQIHEIRVKNGRETINEWRESDGDEPINGVPETDIPIVITATGPIPLNAEAQATRQQVTQPPEPPKEGGHGKGEPGSGDGTSQMKSLLIETFERIQSIANRELAKGSGREAPAPAAAPPAPIMVEVHPPNVDVRVEPTRIDAINVSATMSRGKVKDVERDANGLISKVTETDVATGDRIEKRIVRDDNDRPVKIEESRIKKDPE